jgi:hypothetical protein
MSGLVGSCPTDGMRFSQCTHMLCTDSLLRVGRMQELRFQSPVIRDVVAEAAGWSSRRDPVMPGTGGPAGNARLTAWTGMTLLALSLAELVTLIDVRGLISWHVVIGVLLVPPALVKTASTGWRIVRYYSGARTYVQAGPPPLVRRLLGPAVVLSTLAVLASGLTLVVIGSVRSRTVLLSGFGTRVDWVTVHQAAFVVWAVATGLHVLGRLVPALRLTLMPPRAAPAVPGAGRRAAVLITTLLVALVAGLIVLSTAGSWQLDGDDGARTGLDLHQHVR